MSKTKKTKPQRATRLIGYEYCCTLGEFDSGWQKDLTEALKELKRLTGTDAAGCSLYKREKT